MGTGTEMMGSHLSTPRARRIVWAIVLAALGVVMVGGLSRLEVQTSLQSFLPQDDKVAKSYDEVTETFGADPVVVLLESKKAGALLDPAPLKATVRLEGALSRLPDVAAVYGPGTLLNQIAGRAQDLLAELMGRRDGEIARSRAAAEKGGADASAIKAAGVAARETFDARYGPLLVSGLPSGLPTLLNERFVRSVVMDDGGMPRGQWRFVIPSRKSMAILVRPRERMDSAATARLVAGVHKVVAQDGPTKTRSTVTGTSVVVSALSDRANRDAPLLGGLALVAISMCFMLATWIRRSRRLVPVATTAAAICCTLAALGWLDRPVSLAVIAFMSVLLGMGCYYPTYFAMGASRRTVLVVAGASAASLSTLSLSPLPLVHDLGITMALGVIFSALIALPLRGWLTLPSPDGIVTVERPPRPHKLGQRTAAGILFGAILAAAIGWVQLAQLPLNSDIDEFASGLPELTQARQGETVLGSSGEIDIVLQGIDTLTPEALSWMRQAKEVVVVRHGDRMRPVLSPPDLLQFLGDKPTAGQINAGLRILPDYLSSSVVSPDRSESVMSFGVRVDDLASLRKVRADVERHLPPVPEGYTMEMTGLPIVGMKSEDLIAQDRLLSNAAGIVAAGAVLAFGLRRRSDAWRGVLAASVATGVGFFLLWATGSGLNPITVALGALTAAVGCEFTVLLSESARGHRRLGRAVALVTSTSALGYAVLMASSLDAVRSFGMLLAGAVLLSFSASWLVVRATVRSAQPAPSSATISDRDLVGARR